MKFVFSDQRFKAALDCYSKKRRRSIWLFTFVQKSHRIEEKIFLIQQEVDKELFGSHYEEKECVSFINACLTTMNFIVKKYEDKFHEDNQFAKKSISTGIADKLHNAQKVGIVLFDSLLSYLLKKKFGNRFSLIADDCLELLDKSLVNIFIPKLNGHIGTEKRSRLLREAAVGNIGQWAKA